MQIQISLDDDPKVVQVFPSESTESPVSLDGLGSITVSVSTEPTGPIDVSVHHGPPGPPGSGSSAPRATATYTTASLASGQGENAVIVLSAAYTVLRVQSASGVRVRGYVSAAHRTNDIARPIGSYPSAVDHGLLFEVYDVADLWLPKPADGYTSDSSDNVPIRIDRVSGTGPVTVVLTYLTTEE